MENRSLQVHIAVESHPLEVHFAVESHPQEVHFAGENHSLEVQKSFNHTLSHLGTLLLYPVAKIDLVIKI